MTTLSRYQGIDLILTRLAAVRHRHWLVQVSQAAVGVLTVVAGGLVVLGLVCGYWPEQPPRPLRWVLLAATLAGWGLSAVFVVILPLRRRLNDAQAARLVESAVTGLDNALINAVQLSQDSVQSPPLVQQAILETVRRTRDLAVCSSVATVRLRRRALCAGVAVAALAAFALFQGQHLRRGLSAVFCPSAYVPRIGSIRLLSLSPGDATRFAGEPVTILVRIDNPQRARYDATVEIAGSPGARAMLSSADRTTYSCALGKAEQSFQYAVGIGDSRFPTDKPYYALTVLQRVKVEGLDLLYAHPPYTRLSERNVVNAAGPIEAPAGTLVTATLRLSAKVPGVLLERRSGERLPLRADSAGKTFTGVISVLADDGYRLVLSDSAGRRLGQLPDPSESSSPPEQADGMYPIRALPDGPPKIAFVEPKGDATIAPGGRLAARLRASDDYGLGSVRFFMGRENTPAGMVHDFPKVAGATTVDLEHDLAAGGEYRPGDVIVCYASASDQRMAGLGGPQTAQTPPLKITVQDAEKVAAGKAQRFDLLRGRLLALLAAQERQRVNADLADRQADLPAVRSLGKEIAGGQQAIKLDIFDLVDRFPFDPEMSTIKTALAELGNNDAALAVSQGQVLAGLGEMSARAAACQTVAGTQDRILQAIQWMLALMPSLSKPEIAQKTAEGHDLPAEAKEKLLDLANALDEFIRQQQKVIQSSAPLAKKPADNFTPQDEKLLKDLQAVQDKWEKFLNEQFADFSKLAQQDFSKPSLLKELVSIKTDVTMAKDALQKKATEIATAIEDNGIENAQTLTTNIEKWLPDEPDRIKWSMEDTAEQTSIEQAELPKELEDLVGDLLEQEEDLFEEMEDVTSKYAQSGDKGIGWDAMDGPISNMNAQGVTGNQLPNTSEISGRSGEGRQGKATGEFVEDKAVGKGGRRTPTRLTPEPFQQGQINDTSAEPAGGATGGGKLSGAGGEGLEGPVPPPLAEQMKRLAGRHAQLLNRAERAQAAMKVSDFSNYQFLQTITLMNRVQGDLENYRYANVLRQKPVLLSALKQSRDALTGRIDVTADTTGQLSQQVRDDIADAMRGKLPPEFQEALQRYFLRLSESGGGTGVPPVSPSTRPAGK